MENLATVSTVCYMLMSLIAFGLATQNSSRPTESLQNPNLELRMDQPKKNINTGEVLVHLEPNVILVNWTGVHTLRLDCWATYPIDLRFYGHLTNQETTVKTFRKEHATSKNLSWFIINATMETYEQITGNYTCVSVQNPKRFSSLYIFVSPTPPGVLLTRGQHIKIQTKADDLKINFPCAVSHPDVHVQLYKDDEQVTGLPESKLSYDPKIGFQMAFDKHENFGREFYSCRTELSPKDRVNFTVMSPRAYQVKPQLNNIRLSRSEQLRISCNATEDFVIVTQPSSLPVDSNNVKRVQNGKNEPYYKYLGSYISSPLASNWSGYVSCKWKYSNEIFAQWTFSVMEKDVRKPGELNTAKLNSACPNSKDIILFECSNPVECRINSCPRKDDKCNSNAVICQRDKRCMQNGLLQCATDTWSVEEMFFTGFSVSTSKSNKTTRYVGWHHASIDEILLLEDVSELHHNESGTAQFVCQGSNFVFSSGFKWVIYLTDGTQLVMTSLNDVIGQEMNITVQNLWKEKRSILESRLSIVMGSSSKNISRIKCQAPVWDSYDWISQKMSVHIYSAKPKTEFVTETNSVQVYSGGSTVFWESPTMLGILLFLMYQR